MAATVVARPGVDFVHPDRAKNLSGATPRPAVQRPINNKNIPDSMDQLIDGANKVLRYIENNGQEDPVITGYIRTVKQYAINARQRPKDATAQGDMANVVAALEKIAADTERLNNRMETLEKATTATISASTLSSADRWRAFRTSDWQRGAINAAPPAYRSDGTASPSVQDSELREDREIIVKVDQANREKLRQTQPREIVLKAEQLREKQARKKTSAALAGGAYFVAARVLPSGDVSMLVNSASGAELLRRHTEWVSFFGRAARIQKPSWGVVVHGLPVKTFNLTTETAAGLASELQRQNSMSWGGDKAEILHLSWLTRPGGNRREASVVIEFDNPVLANQAIDAGLVWDHEIHTVVLFCRDGRVKLCRKCQKTGHIQSHCPAKDFTCGHCAKQHPTWECESERGVPILTKCANCDGNHRPTSAECPAKREARRAADEIRARCPPYHRVPLRFRPRPADKDNGLASLPARTMAGTNLNLNGSIHAPTAPTPAALTQVAPTPAANTTTINTNILSTQRSAPTRRGPGRPRGSKNKPKEPAAGEDDDLPAQPEITESALTVSRRSRTSRSQQDMVQLMTDPERLLHSVNKRRRMIEPENLMEEDPDTDIWATQLQQQEQQPEQQVPSPLPAEGLLEVVDDEQFFEASDGSDHDNNNSDDNDLYNE
jgi:hypothetical protein